MAQPAGDERTARPEAVDGDRLTPEPAPSTCHPADLAEHEARLAVEGRGIIPDPHRRKDRP